MISTSYLQKNAELNSLIDFKPVDIKESKARDSLGGKTEINVRIMCLNALPGYVKRDLEELRMFEYSYCYHNYLLNFARQKASQKVGAIQTTFSSIQPSLPQALPAVVSNTYIIPPPSTTQSTFPTFPAPTTTTQSSFTQPFSFQQPTSSGGGFQSAANQSKTVNPFSLNATQPGLNTLNTNTSFFPNSNPVSSAPLFGAPQSTFNPISQPTVPNPLNSIWNSNPQQSTSNTGQAPAWNTAPQQNSVQSGLSSIWNAQSQQPASQSNPFSFNPAPQQPTTQTNFSSFSTFASITNPAQSLSSTRPSAPFALSSQPSTTAPGLSTPWNTSQTQNTGLSSSWNTSQPPTLQPPALLQQPVYPSSHLGSALPPYMPYPPPYAPSRYYPYPDPYAYPRPTYPPPPYDPYFSLYRDDSYYEPKNLSLMAKLLSQRQAAHQLEQKYGIDPSIPLSDTFFDRSRNKIMEQNVARSNDPIIQVVPALAGFKDGKQQIVLNIEETPENKAYIPKIFNPNSEISFNITAKENSASRSYLASVADSDNAGNENARTQTSPLSQQGKDLPKPILNKKQANRRKSILEMELTDYQTTSKIDTTLADDSLSKRVTFQDESVLKKENISKTQNLSPRLDSSFPRNSYSSGSASSISVPRQKPLTIAHTYGSPILGGTLSNFDDSLFAGSSGYHPDNESRVSISRFKWTPSWFISKIITGFSHQQEGQRDKETPSITEIVEPMECGVKLTRDDYYIRPSKDELDKISTDRRCIAHNFIVGRYNVGKVLFHGETDVFGLDIDKIVFIHNYEIEVYRDDDPNFVKPPVGTGLNKPATLTLFNVFPQDSDGKCIKDFDHDSLEDFEKYLKEKAAKQDAEFVEYIPETGSFSFTVKHFTKYSISLQDSACISLHRHTPSISSLDESHFEENQIKNEVSKDDSTLSLPNPLISNNNAFFIESGNKFMDTHSYNKNAPFKGYSANVGFPLEFSRIVSDKCSSLNESIFPRECVVHNQSFQLSQLNPDVGAFFDSQVK